ncbi:MAG: transglutaminase family protein, partial [Planctomycetes bacterium]|nr:transglutaminase family protein [Planctomycetota bacterium]
MSLRIALNHKTSYQYDRPINVAPQMVRLRPAPGCRTPIASYSLRVSPASHFINWQQDPHGNFLARLVFPDKISRMEIEVDLVAEMAVINPFDFFLEPAAELYPFDYDAGLRHELAPYLAVDAPGPLLSQLVQSIDRTQRKTVDFLVELNQRVQKEIRYLVRLEEGVQSSEQTLELKSGSCRDSALLLVEILRNLGLAARFVSGYLIQLVADQKSLDGPSGAEADFTDLHAWTEVYLPGAGWLGLSITRVHEDPRVTKPYTEEQWASIETLGREIDQRLEQGGARLTQGGEPTFVSIDDMQGPEWTIAALGESKRKLAGQLLHRLNHRFATGGLLHHGQGKWYPGEQLPRWALSCWWRKDGQPIWRTPELLADPTMPGDQAYPQAERFAQRLAERLQVGTDKVVPAYEDALYSLWRERRLPVNVTVHESKLEDEVERARLARVFE